MTLQRTLASCCLALATCLAQADEWNIGAGYLFRPGSAYASVDYRWSRFGVEALSDWHGHEEPTTKPGPDFSVSGLYFITIPQLPQMPVFVSAGVVTGWGKSGLAGGFGAEYHLSRHWGIRFADNLFLATEDANNTHEGENLASVGLHFRF